MSLPLEFHAVTVFIFYWYFFTGMMVCPEHCILHFGGNCPKGCTMGAETVVVLGGQCYSLAAKQLFHIHSLGGSAISLILWRRYCESCTDQLVCYCLWLAQPPLYKCHLMSSHSNAVTVLCLEVEIKTWDHPTTVMQQFTHRECRWTHAVSGKKMVSGLCISAT